jgi:hypothetical protein
MLTASQHPPIREPPSAKSIMQEHRHKSKEQYAWTGELLQEDMIENKNTRKLNAVILSKIASLR